MRADKRIEEGTSRGNKANCVSHLSEMVQNLPNCYLATLESSACYLPLCSGSIGSYSVLPLPWTWLYPRLDCHFFPFKRLCSPQPGYIVPAPASSLQCAVWLTCPSDLITLLNYSGISRNTADTGCLFASFPPAIRLFALHKNFQLAMPWKCFIGKIITIKGYMLYSQAYAQSLG